MTKQPCPYRGLTSFDERDSQYFFGRDRDARLIAADLFASPLTLLYGASGVGKSSVIRAGVLPLLRPRRDVVVTVFNAWQGDPLPALKKAFIKNVAKTKPIRFRAAASLREILLLAAKRLKRRIFVILDQFEEYSLYHPTDDDFAVEFSDSANIDDLSVTFLLSLREEAVARLDRFEDHVPTIFDNRRRIEHLDFEAARHAIERPVERFNSKYSKKKPISVDPQLIDAVLCDVRTENVQIGTAGRGTAGVTESNRIETPYLQLVMTRLWNFERDRDSNVLQLETFTRLGGAQTIVEDHLRGVMGKLSESHQELAAHIFQFLVTPSATKIAHTARDLAASAMADERLVTEILESLSTGPDRILRPVAALPERPREPRYEIFHDKLAKSILAWRAEYLKAKEVHEVKRVELELAQHESSIRHVLDSLSGRQRESVRRALSLLITPSGSRASLTAAEIANGANTTVQRMIPILLWLESAQIVALRSDPHHPEHQRRYEIIHDLLIKPIRDWIDLEVARRQPRAAAVIHMSTARWAGFREAPIRDSTTVVFGSGASASARELDETWYPGAPFAPTSRELAQLLADECRFDLDEGTGLAEVCSYFIAMYDRGMLERRLRQVFKPIDRRARIHDAVARIAAERPLLILTTTFDTLVEQALDEQRVRHTVFANITEETDTLLCRRPNRDYELVRRKEAFFDRDHTLVYKVFGTLTGSSFFISEEDEMELFARFSAGELPPPRIAERFIHSTPLFIGMSLRSWTQRLLVSSLRRRRVSKGFAITLGANVVDRLRWERAGIELFEMDINEFASRLSVRPEPGRSTPR